MCAPRVSVIILNYNGMRFVQRCLDSVLQTGRSGVEIIVADNCSVDGSLEWIESHYRDPRLRCVRLTRNWGYAGGNNRAANSARGDYLVFLNVDTEVQQEWLDQIVASFEADAGVGIVQSRLREMRYPGVLQSAGAYLDGFGLCHTRGVGTVEQGQYSEVEEIFSATGAAMAVRASVFRQLGGFDGSYFCYFEETDLCWRAWLCGYKVLFVPESVVYHHGGGSSDGGPGYNAQNYYLYTRNRLTSFIKLLEWPLLLFWLPANIAIVAAAGASALLRSGDTDGLGVLLKSVSSNIAHLGRTLRERRHLRRARKESNWALIRRGLIRGIDLRLIWRDYTASTA